MEHMGHCTHEFSKFGVRSSHVAGLVPSGAPDEKLFRWGHSACASDEGSLIIFGGYGGPERHARLNDVLEWSIKDGSCSCLITSNTPLPMMAHTALRVADSMVVIGGRMSPTCILNTVCVLDLNTMEWNFPAVMGVKFPPRHRHAAAAVGSSIYVYGGLNGSEILGDLHMLDTSSWTWSVVCCKGKTPLARHSHSLAVIESKLYIYGGRGRDTVYGDLHVLDLETRVWAEPEIKGNWPSRRFSHTMTAMGRYIAVIGGCPITNQGSDLVIMDVERMTWVRPQVLMPRGKLLVRHSTTLLGDSLVVIGGGAACFAFGTSFSPTFALNLKPFLNKIMLLEEREVDIGHSTEIPRESREHGKQESGNWVLKIEKDKAKESKDALKILKWLDPRRKPKVLYQGTHVAFPISAVAVPFLQKDGLVEQKDPFNQSSASATECYNCSVDQARVILLACGGEVLNLEGLPYSKQHSSPIDSLQTAISVLLEQNNLALSLLEELPKRWERLGDMIVLPAGSLCSISWSSLGEQLWKTIAHSLGGSRLARQQECSTAIRLSASGGIPNALKEAPIAPTGTRDSRLQLLYGLDGWVEHRENGIRYCLDATKCMYSSGNVSEKLRIGSISCRGATVVDLFAGIGYYVLPFLLKAGAQKVYACEWNPHAIRALRHNLRINGVEDKCGVIEGDNRITAPQGVADIVSLGLLPTSEGSWHAAVRALRPEGGMLLVHENVKDTEESVWINYLLASILNLSTSLGRAWNVSLVHFERVKWYAPHIRHVVADVCCKQASG